MTLYLKVTPAFAKAVEQRDLKNADYFRFNRLLDAFGSVVTGVGVSRHLITKAEHAAEKWLVLEGPEEAQIPLKDKLTNDPAFKGLFLSVTIRQA